MIYLHPQRLFGYIILIGFAWWATAQANWQASVDLVQYGVASWYGEPFHGRLTANGERYNMYELTAAHKQAPLGIHAIVTHVRTGRQVRIRITDRGPFVGNRLIDLSYGAARQLGMVEDGLAPVMIEFLPDTQPQITFVVQAGSYRDANNALVAKRRLSAAYPGVSIRKLSQSKTPIYRVQLGPFKTRPQAETRADQVRRLGYNGLIIPHTQSITSLPTQP